MGWGKKIKEECKIIEIVSLTSFFCIFIFFSLFYLFIPYLFEETMMDITLNRYASYYKNDFLISNITNNCKNFEKDFDKVSCVHNFFVKNYKFKLRHNHRINSPSTTFSKGGVCRDSSAIYCTIFKKMGLECEFIHKYKEHVFSAVFIDDSSYHVCFLDQKSMVCI